MITWEGSWQVVDICPWYLHDSFMKSPLRVYLQYIPSIFHFSIFTNPYSTSVYPMKSPGNPHGTYLWDTQNSDSGRKAKAYPSTAENSMGRVAIWAFDGFDWGKKGGTSAWNAWIMSYRWIGDDWVWLGLSEKKEAIPNLTPEPPICHGDPNVGCPDHMILICLLPDGVPRLKTAIR